MPLRQHAVEMRDLYANEIASAVHGGEQPSRLQLESWARYDAAVRDADPAAVFGAVSSARLHERGDDHGESAEDQQDEQDPLPGA